MEMNFCRRCGAALRQLNDNAYSCTNDHTIFANSSPTVGVFLINNKNEVLLSVRGIEPHKGMLDAFGGFVDGEETLEHAITRELQEELGLDASEYASPQFLCSAMGHYEYKNEVLPVLSSLFWARLKTDRTLVAADDVAEIHVSAIKDIDLTMLHDDDIRTGIQKLRSLNIL